MLGEASPWRESIEQRGVKRVFLASFASIVKICPTCQIQIRNENSCEVKSAQEGSPRWVDSASSSGSGVSEEIPAARARIMRTGRYRESGACSWLARALTFIEGS